MGTKLLNASGSWFSLHFVIFFYLGCNQLDMQSHLLITNNFDRNLTIFTYISFHNRCWSLNKLFRLFCLLRFRHNSFSVKYSASTYFRLELIEPSAKEVFIFWSEKSRGQVRGGEANTAQKLSVLKNLLTFNLSSRQFQAKISEHAINPSRHRYC